MYFVLLPFNKNQCVKLKFPNQKFEDYDVIPWALIPKELSEYGFTSWWWIDSRQLLGLYVQILSQFME